MFCFLAKRQPLTGIRPLVPMPGGGKPLADGYRGCLVQVRGDWQWFCQIFGFPQWNSERCCPFCRASSTVPARTYTDFGFAAGWRATRFTHESYLAYLAAAGFAMPVLFAVVLGLRLECVNIDVLHTVEQGFGSHIVGNVIWYIVVLKNALGGNTYAERIRRCNDDIKQWYKRNTSIRSKLNGVLTKERVREDGEWPKLKAKAAATRNLAGYALYLMVTYGQPESDDPFRQEHDVLALGVCQLLVRFYEILEHNSQFLSQADRDYIPTLGNQLCSIYAKLSFLCYNAGIKLWKLTPKMHLFLELCEVQMPTHGNARFWWTYSDEDLVGALIDVAEGLHPATMAEILLTKWLTVCFDECLVEYGDNE